MEYWRGVQRLICDLFSSSSLPVTQKQGFCPGVLQAFISEQSYTLHHYSYQKGLMLPSLLGWGDSFPPGDTEGTLSFSSWGVTRWELSRVVGSTVACTVLLPTQ